MIGSEEVFLRGGIIRILLSLMGKKQIIVQFPVMVLGIDEFFDKCIETWTESLAPSQFAGVVRVNKWFRTENSDRFQYRYVSVKTVIEFFKIIERHVENRYFFGELVVVIRKRFGVKVHEIQSSRKTSGDGICCFFPFAGLLIDAIPPSAKEFVMIAYDNAG